MSYKKKNPFLRKVAVEMLCVVFVGFCLSVVSCNKPNQEELNFNSKEELDSTKKGYVTFGSNSGIINCISYITVFVDGKNIGTLQGGTVVDSISYCGMDGNITKEIPIGKHTYKVEIRPPNGGGCLKKDITGTFQVSENECTKIFIDYYQLFGNNQCDQDVIISETEYENAPNDSFEILDMKIVNNCLKVKFSASGCSGNSWNVKLIDQGSLFYSNPAKRTLRLSLDNKEECCAVITKEISFNIEDLQLQGSNRVSLNISGRGILYEY